VVLNNPKGIFNDTRGEQDGDKIIPTLIGCLAGANVTRSVTNITLSNLKSVTVGSAPSNLAATNIGSTAVTLTWQDDGTDVEGLINSGQLVLINKDGVVKVGIGINSLTDPPDGSNDPDAENDEKYIEIVEAEDMIQDDISKAFDAGYQGSTKNKLDNQMLFVNEVNQYFDGLESIDVLDDQYNNTSDIDVDAQREAWKKAGADNIDAMTDAQIKQFTYKRSLFLKGDIKILFAMANLDFVITMHN
jgi:Phage tail sheath protein.